MEFYRKKSKAYPNELKGGPDMPFCPVCKTEYRQGFTVCSDCGHALVDSLPAGPEQEKETDIYIDDEPAFLVSGNSEIECAIIEGCLRSANIPYLKKDQETGGYMRVYMGYSVFGSKYYVPSRLLTKAKEALDAACPPDSLEIQGEETAEEESYPNRDETEIKAKRHGRFASVAAIVIVAIILLNMIFILVSSIIQFVQSFRG